MGLLQDEIDPFFERDHELENSVISVLRTKQGEYLSVKNISKEICEPIIGIPSYYDEVSLEHFESFLEYFLDQLCHISVLKRKLFEGFLGPHYTIFENSNLAHSSEDNSGQLTFDSSTWTGLPKIGVIEEQSLHRLRIALNIVNSAVEMSGASNAEKAQARAYILALHALADSPEPPADLIYKIITFVAALTSIGAFFVAVAALYK